VFCVCWNRGYLQTLLYFGHVLYFLIGLGLQLHPVEVSIAVIFYLNYIVCCCNEVLCNSALNMCKYVYKLMTSYKF
jgi:hypothetical protein